METTTDNRDFHSHAQGRFNPYKFRHFYKNKYLITPFSERKYALSYNYRYKCLWFRTPKVGSRSINDFFIENTPKKQYIYGSAVGYCRGDFKDWFKFAFVREPTDRFVSCWKDKVLNQNFFQFDEHIHQDMKTLANFISWVEKLDMEKADEHLRPQHLLIDAENLDFLGKLESFDADFKHVSETIGMPIKELHRKNASGKKSVDVSPSDQQRIIKIYLKDYQLFYPDELSGL